MGDEIEIEMADGRIVRVGVTEALRKIVERRSLDCETSLCVPLGSNLEVVVAVRLIDGY